MNAHIFGPLRAPALGCTGSSAQLPQTLEPLSQTSLALNISALPSASAPTSCGLPWCSSLWVRKACLSCLWALPWRKNSFSAECCWEDRPLETIDVFPLCVLASPFEILTVVIATSQGHKNYAAINIKRYPQIGKNHIVIFNSSVFANCISKV